MITLDEGGRGSIIMCQQHQEDKTNIEVMWILIEPLKSSFSWDELCLQKSQVFPLTAGLFL